jgi:hypothetical protein
MVTFWLIVPTPGYGVDFDAASWITSPLEAHASAAWIVPNGFNFPFAEHAVTVPDGATNQVRLVAAEAALGNSTNAPATNGMTAAAPSDRRRRRPPSGEETG